MSTEQFIEFLGMKVKAEPRAALPVITFAHDTTFHVNGEEILVEHVPNAHTDGDAIVYFRMRGGVVFFWLIFATLLLPLEVRIIPSYEVVHQLGMLNSYPGLIIPLIASATGTFFFRQFFLSVPDELLEAARLDKAGPIKFFLDILLPISRPMIAALFIIMFVYGWNQYLWPTLMTTDERYFTLVRGIKQILQVWMSSQIPAYNEAMAMAILAILPPVAVVVLFQRWFIKGLTESDR